MPTTRIPYGVLDGRYVNAAGDTMLGELTLAGAPTLDLHASTKKYVDDAIGVGGHTHTLSAGATDVTAKASEVNLLDLSGLSTGQVLRATGAASAAWGNIQAGDLPAGIDAAYIADGSVSNAEYQYLNGVTSAIQTQLDAKAADSIVLKKDGSVSLTADWDIGDLRTIQADEIRARDGDGLKLSDDGGNGIFIKDGGNVGIGVADPTYKLHMQDGYFYFPGFYSSPGNVVNFSNEVIAWDSGTPADPCYTFGNDNDTGMYRATADYVGIAAGGIEAMRIGSFVGVGTDNPDRKLDVLDSSTAQLRLTHTDNSIYTEFRANSNGYLYISTTGKRVGIDRASPDASLHLIGGDTGMGYTAATMALGYSTLGNYPHFIHTRHNAGNSSNNAIDFYTSDGTSSGVYPTNAVHGMTITAGYVGIGTNGPGRKLDVLDASNSQLRLTHTDGSIYTDLQTDNSGNLTITPSGSKVLMAKALEIDGTFDHDGSAFGVFGVTPASRVAAYTVTNAITDRSFDADNTTIAELADVVATIINDLKTYGFFQ